VEEASGYSIDKHQFYFFGVFKMLRNRHPRLLLIFYNDFCSYILYQNFILSALTEDIMQLCSEARKYGLFGVCVNPCYVGLARHLLSDTNVKVVTVVGFPLGATFSEVKALETKMAVEAHADEIDIVMNVSAFKTGDYAAVVSDIRSVVEAASPFPVKVIIEACLLTDAEKCTACRLVAEGGAAFVKTSTGFNKGMLRR